MCKISSVPVLETQTGECAQEAERKGWLPTEQTSGPQPANFLILCGLQVESNPKSSGTKSTWETEEMQNQPHRKT